MNRREVIAMIKDLAEELDSDIAKQLDEETAECPDEVADRLAGLVRIADQHLAKAWIAVVRTVDALVHVGQEGRK